MTQPATNLPESIPPWTLGWRLQRALDWAGMTTEAMARELEVSRSTVSGWLNDHHAPRAIYVRAWAHRCRVPYTWLATGDGSEHQPVGWYRDHGALPPPPVAVAGDVELSGREILALQRRFRHLNRPAALGRSAEAPSAVLPTSARP